MASIIVLAVVFALVASSKHEEEKRQSSYPSRNHKATHDLGKIEYNPYAADMDSDAISPPPYSSKTVADGGYSKASKRDALGRKFKHLQSKLHA